MLQSMLLLAKYLRCYAVDLLEYLIEIRDGAKTDIIADGRDRIVGMLQLEGCLLQANLVQVFRHRTAGVLPELPA